MAPKPTTVHDRRKRLGRALRTARERAGRDLAEAAAPLGWTAERLGALEEGLVTIRRADAKELLTGYGAADAATLALVEGTAGWWTPHSDLVDEPLEKLLVLEDGMARLRSHQAGLVPGLLQTPDYAWELMVTMSDQPLDRVQRLVDLRRARARAFTREPRPQVTVVLDEGALRRPVGGPAVMRRQYRHLIETGRLPGADVRVRPFDAAPHHASGLTFHVFEFTGDGPVVQLELLDREELIRSEREVALYRDAFDLALAGALSREESVAFLQELERGC
ncbi:helix-turn-helix domain-containing protein [Actinomadura opuntiae]|uniref:helix-turn-helix domain-containing protein n=1 Tax=Actinomadura sp. OS1-43 TaxID=604315 RepID=UPI00255AC184|nr:helix-turn-helix transcriptional regulator [Actinomadura sp. OS1-43]MDL4815152.1 helix-turn-helix transcriptional regulator [Actinomadura sp. OS1-43]